MDPEYMTRAAERLGPLLEEFHEEVVSHSDLTGLDHFRAMYASYLISSALELLSVDDLEALDIFTRDIRDTSNFYYGELEDLK